MDPEPADSVEMKLQNVRMVVGDDGHIRLPAFSLEGYIVVGTGDLEKMLSAAYRMGVDAGE